MRHFDLPHTLAILSTASLCSWASAQACESFSFECYFKPPSEWSVPYVRDNGLTRLSGPFGGYPNWSVLNGHVDFVRGDWPGSSGPSSIEIGGRGETGRLGTDFWATHLGGMFICGHFDVSVNPDTYSLDSGPYRIFMEVNGGILFSHTFEARELMPTREDMKWQSVPFSFWMNTAGNTTIAFYTLDATASGVVIDNLRFDQAIPPDIEAPFTAVCQGGVAERHRSIEVPDGASVVWQVVDGWDSENNQYLWRTLGPGDTVGEPGPGVQFVVDYADADRLVLSDVRAMFEPPIYAYIWTRCAVTTGCRTRGENFAIAPRHSEFNCDGFIDFFDYDAFVQCYEVEVCPPGQTADRNGDGFVDFFDYDLFVYAFENGW